MKKYLTMMMIALGLFALPLTLTGCNTMEGAGEDIEAAGESVEEAAE